MSLWVHSVNLILYTVAIAIPQNELSLIFIWTFVLILVVTFDPWILNCRFRWAFPTYILLVYGIYSSYLFFGLEKSASIEFFDFQRDVLFISYVVLLFLAMVAYFQMHKSYNFEMNIEETQERLMAILSTTESGIALYNAEGEAVHFNRAALDILDVTEEECRASKLTDSHCEAIHIDGRPFELHEFPVRRVLDSKCSVVGVLMGIHGGRQPRRWLRIHASPLSLGANENFFVVVSFSDITEIIDAQEMTTGFYRNSPHGMGVLGSDLRFIRFNNGLAESFQVKELGLIYDYIVTEDILYFEEGLEQAKKSKVGQCYLRWQSNPHVVQNVDLYIYWSERSAQFFIQLHDITELRSLYIKQKAIMDALDRTTIMVVYDKEGRIKEVNKKFLLLSGFEREDVFGQGAEILKSGKHDDEFYENLRLSLRRGIVWNGEVCHQGKDGRLYWSYSTFTPSFDELGHMSGYIEIAQDITALKLAQAQAVQAGKMATLGEMASGVAHEINNPLAVIGGRAALLKKRLSGDTDEAKKFVLDIEKIEMQVQRITKIVNGLRAFSRSSAKDPKMPNSLKKIVEDSIELVVERYLKNNVQIEVVPFDEIQIDCRHIEITQVLVNLLNNSFDAVSNLDEKWIRIEVLSEAKKVTLIVTDSGFGIAPEVVEKIMNPFFTTKEIGKGTGLGLSISKGIIEDHGGTLEYNPKFDRTQFLIHFSKL